MSSVKYISYSLSEKKEVQTERTFYCISAVSNKMNQRLTREPPDFTVTKSQFGKLNLSSFE
jgi:hypothetical protein